MTEVFDNENKGKPTFTFVVATQMSEDDWRSGSRELPIMQSLAKMTLSDVDVRVYVFFDNHDGLPTCYNKALDNIKDSAFLCFVHDDWTLLDCFFFDKLVKSKFDVVGVAGGLEYTPPPTWQSKPFLWTSACNGKGSGFVFHTFPSGALYPSSFGPAPCPCVWIDGQCLILGKNAIAKGLKFEETWKFDFYDGQLAFDALKLGLKVGVEPIACVHESAGYGVNSHINQYMNDQLKFIEKNLKKI